jgi:hypothetical protein
VHYILCDTKQEVILTTYNLWASLGMGCLWPTEVTEMGLSSQENPYERNYMPLVFFLYFSTDPLASFSII